MMITVIFCIAVLFQLAFSFPLCFSSKLRASKCTILLSRKNSESTVVIAYNKPPNLITSHSSADATRSQNGTWKTVYDDIFSLQGYTGNIKTHRKQSSSADRWEEVTGIRSKLHAIGRLDADTTGLLLLTNDGRLVHHVSNPVSSSGGEPMSKTYEAVIMGHHEDDSSPGIQAMREEGVDIGKKYGGWTKPVDDLHILEHPTTKSTRLTITISEGKNRQVRRMFHAIGSGVMKLKRIRIGPHLTLQGLEEGQWRILSDREVQKVLNWKVRKLDDQLPTRFAAKVIKPKLNQRRRQRRK